MGRPRALVQVCDPSGWYSPRAYGRMPRPASSFLLPPLIQHCPSSLPHHQPAASNNLTTLTRRCPRRRITPPNDAAAPPSPHRTAGLTATLLLLRAAPSPLKFEFLCQNPKGTQWKTFCYIMHVELKAKLHRNSHQPTWIIKEIGSITTFVHPMTV
jgi:hypothetical protein